MFSSSVFSENNCFDYGLLRVFFVFTGLLFHKHPHYDPSTARRERRARTVRHFKLIRENKVCDLVQEVIGTQDGGKFQKSCISNNSREVTVSGFSRHEQREPVPLLFCFKCINLLSHFRIVNGKHLHAKFLDISETVNFSDVLYSPECAESRGLWAGKIGWSTWWNADSACGSH